MKLFSIFGNPVAHSRSPLLHNSVFLHAPYNAVYIRQCVADEKDLLPTLETLSVDGGNITVPYKEEAFRICDEVRGIACKIGAVNTIVRREDRWIGYNTDAPGFMEAIGHLSYKRAVILGAGGTARAIAVAFEEAGIDFCVVNRSRGRLAWFASRGYCVKDWESFDPSSGYDLIINTTSAGLTDDAYPLEEGVLRTLFERACYAVDCIYGHQTPFLALAQNYGLVTQDGGEMLIQQAILANEIFTDGKISRIQLTKLMKEAFIL